jgi:zinc protease
MKTLGIWILLLTHISLSANDYFSDKVEKFKWDDLDVVYIEDNRFPTYAIGVYFADGALSDGKVKGVTDAALSYMDLGTRRFSREEIADNLEFFGVGLGSEVTHEFSSYMVSGLVKDIIPTMKKVCHLFQDATYPMNELKKEIKRSVSDLQNSAQNPGFLASRAFREISLAGTPFSYPVDGKIVDIKKLNSSLLKEKLNYLNHSVKKRIYITGPKNVLQIKSTLLQDCGWKGQGTFVRNVDYKYNGVKKGPRITLVTIDAGNQAQVRIGKTLTEKDAGKTELKKMTSNYLGGGFTSQLMNVLRVENGLTYSVGAFAGMQKKYGRAGIYTSTNIETLNKLLAETKKTLDKNAQGDIDERGFQLTKGSLAGGYPFAFESTKAILSQLMTLDHLGESYSTLVESPAILRSITKNDLIEDLKSTFSWNEQDIVILAPKNVLSTLKEFGSVDVKSYKEFL